MSWTMTMKRIFYYIILSMMKFHIGSDPGTTNFISASTFFTEWSDLFSEIKITWDRSKEFSALIAIPVERSSEFWTWVQVVVFGL
jgi:hypothetical protein